jgi:biopolymer transport protein ExbD
MGRAGTVRKLLLLGRQKKLIERKSGNMGLDVTPMGDLSFLLFIFFMVTGSFILREGIFFSLPSMRSDVIRLNPNQAMEVTPLDNGFVFHNMLLDREAFVKEVKRIQNKGGKVLVINMNPDVKYDRLVDTLSVARETGTRKVSLSSAGKGGEQ